MPKLSVVIITLNEERNILRCLQSVKGIADEVIVVDSFSTDRTPELCKEAGVTFIQRRWEGYSATKNYAASQASNDWILSVDADEALSDALRFSVEKIKSAAEPVFGQVRRLTNYCGQWIRHCGWYPDVKLRLYDRRLASWQGEVHEQLVLSEPRDLRLLDGDLLHYSYYTTDEHDRQLEKFSALRASELFTKGEQAGWLKIGVKTFSKFLKIYVTRRGFLDGYYGWVIAVKSARESYLRYSGLRRLHQQSAVQ